MKRTPLEICNELAAQWNTVSSTVFIEAAKRNKIEATLTRLRKNIDICQQYEIGKKKMTGEYAALEYGESFLPLPKDLQRLNRLFDNVIAACEDRPDKREEANLLKVLALSCGDAIRTSFQYNSKLLPNLRHKMKVNQDHPNYPVYPEGALTSEELTDLRNIRDALENIKKADALLGQIPITDQTPTKTILKQHPDAALFIGFAPDQSRDAIDAKLQADYTTAYNKGVGTLSRAFGSEKAAEEAMLKEVEAIESHNTTPRGVSANMV